MLLLLFFSVRCHADEVQRSKIDWYVGQRPQFTGTSLTIAAECQQTRPLTANYICAAITNDMFPPVMFTFNPGQYITT